MHIIEYKYRITKYNTNKTQRCMSWCANLTYLMALDVQSANLDCLVILSLEEILHQAADPLET